MQKEQTIPGHREWTVRNFDSNWQFSGGYYWDIPSRRDTIVYDDGPRYSGGSNVWKKCVHTLETGSTGAYVDATLRRQHPYDPTMSLGFKRIHFMVTNDSSRIPDGTFDESLAGNIRDQLDLNTRDSVLLYSGVIQAVPLLGSVFTLNKILRRITKKMKKELLHKPFTTVVKSAISLDFIDRFVISPTLDDAVKFANATNYCLNVINTAHERNSSKVALQAESFVGSKSERHVTESHDWVNVQYDEVTKIGTTSKLFVLVDADYDVQAIDPIKLWAARVGLTKPLDSVWDLVPFSFVVDYFTRAGDFIAGLSNEMSGQQGLIGKITNVYGAWGTLRSEATITRKGISCSPSGRSYTFVEGPVYGTQLRTGYRFRRFPVSLSILLNSLPTDNALINVDLSTVRARTLVELFVQAKL